MLNQEYIGKHPDPGCLQRSLIDSGSSASGFSGSAYDRDHAAAADQRHRGPGQGRGQLQEGSLRGKYVVGTQLRVRVKS